MLPTHHAGGDVQVQGTLLLQDRQRQAEEVHGEAQLGGAGVRHGWQGWHGDPWWCGDSFWLSQWIVHQASCHSPNGSLELQGKEAQVKLFAIFAFTVKFTFLQREIAARTTTPSQAP